MLDPTITCPNCGTEIPLTESLAAPMLKAEREGFEARIAAMKVDAEKRLTVEKDKIAAEAVAKARAAFGSELDTKQSEIATLQESIRERDGKVADLQKRQAELAKQRQELEDQKIEFEETMNEKLRSERAKIAADAERKARVALQDDMDTKARELGELQETLAAQRAKLQAANAAQAELLKKQRELEEQKVAFEESMNEKLRGERAKIAADAERKTRIALQDDMDSKSRELGELQETLTAQRAKLQEANAAQAELLKKQRELEDQKAQMQLDIQKQVQEELDAVRTQAQKEAAEANSLKLAESHHTIDAMRKQIEDLKRKAEQGSQQIQGEVQELELESQLSARFTLDTIAPVPKGEFGGDALQTVNGPLGQACGTILWESKRTKAWSDGWLGKLRNDQRTAKAEVAVIVSQALPKEVDTFTLIDGVWVTSPRCAIPLAICLRQSLLEVALTKQARQGQDTKTVLLYEYLTGAQFRQRVEAIVEAFSTMNDDLAKEKRAIQRQWAKREKQLEAVMVATAGMYGDLQGIAGQSIKEIEGLELLGASDMIEHEAADEDDGSTA